MPEMWETTTEDEAFRASQQTPAATFDRTLAGSIYDKDVLALDYPALTQKIRDARTKGFSDDEIRARLRRDEVRHSFSMMPDELDKHYGRTAESRVWSNRVMAQRGEAEMAALTRLPMEQIRQRSALADKLGMSRSAMFDDKLYAEASKRVKVIDSMTGAAKNAWESVRLNQQAAELVFNSMGRDRTPEEQAQLDELNSELAKRQHAVYTTLRADVAAATTDLAAQQVYGVKEGATTFPAYLGAAMAAGGAVAALPMGSAALAAGAAGTAASAAMVHGSFLNSAKLEAASLYEDLTDAGIDKPTARLLALGGGALNGAIEVGNISSVLKVVPGVSKAGEAVGRFMDAAGLRIIRDNGGVKALLAAPSVQGAIAEGLKNYAMGVGSETAEEVEQAVVSTVITELAKRHAGQEGKSVTECLKDIMAEGTAALGQMAKGMLPGAAINTAMDAVAAKNAPTVVQTEQTEDTTIPKRTTVKTSAAQEDAPTETTTAPVVDMEKVAAAMQREAADADIESDLPEAAEARAVRDDVTRRLMESGRNEQEAKDGAELMARYLLNWSRRLSIDDEGKPMAQQVSPKTLYERIDIGTTAKALNGETYHQSMPVFGGLDEETGRIVFTSDEQSQAVISLFKNADQTTFLHEMGHLILENLMTAGQMENVPQSVKDDWQTAKEFLGLNDFDFSTHERTAEQEAQLTAAHEKFAKSFETYLFTADAPTPALRKVFMRLREWLKSLYCDACNVLGWPQISPEIKSVFNHVFAAASDEAYTLNEMERQERIYDEQEEYRVEMMERELTDLEIEEAGLTDEEGDVDYDDEGTIREEDGNAPRILAALREAEEMETPPKWTPQSMLHSFYGTQSDTQARDALVAKIRKLGGISLNSAKQQLGVDRARELRDRYPSMFKRNGRGIDLMIEDLKNDNNGYNFEYVSDLEEYLTKNSKADDAAEREAEKRKLDVPITEETLPGLFFLLNDKDVRKYARQRMRKLAAVVDQLQAEHKTDELREYENGIADEWQLCTELLQITKSKQKRQDGEAKQAKSKAKPAPANLRHESIATREAAERAAGLLDDKTITITEADKRAWTLAERVSKDVYSEGVREGKAQQREVMNERLSAEREKAAAKLEAQQEKFAAKLEAEREKSKDKLAAQRERAKAQLQRAAERFRAWKDARREREQKKREFYATRKEIDKILRRLVRMRHFNRNDIDFTAHEKINGILDEYKLKSVSEAMRARAAILKNTLDAQADAARDNLSDVEDGEEQVAEMLSDTTLRDMTLDQLRALKNRVAVIYAQGKDLRKAEVQAEREQHENLFNELFSRLKERYEAAQPQVITGAGDLHKQYKGVAGKLEAAKDWMYAASLSSHRLFDWIGGGMGKYDSIWTDVFNSRVNAAHDEYQRNVGDRHERMEAVRKELGLSWRDLSKVRVIDGQEYTVDEIMSVYALLQNEKGKAALLNGNITAQFSNVPAEREAHAKRVAAALKDNERKLADAVIADFDGSFDRLNAKLISALNVGMAKEENYTPLRRLEYSVDMEEMQVNDDGTTGKGGYNNMLATLEKGFMQARKSIKAEHQKSVDLGLLSIWNTQVELQEHTAAFAALANDLRWVLQAHDSTLAKAIRIVYGDEAWHAVKTYVNTVMMDDQRQAHNSLDKLASFFGRNMSMVYLGGSISVYLKQWTSLPLFLASAGPVSLFASLGRYLTHPRRFMAEVYELDPQIKERIPNAFYNITRIDPTTAGEYNYLTDRMLKSLMTIGAYQDRVTAGIGMKAVYDSNIKRGLSHEESLRAAQRAVATTQQVPNMKDMPMFWRQSGLAKLMLIFSSQSIPVWGMTVYDMAQAIRRGEYPAALSTFTALSVGAAAMALLTKGPPPDDSDETWTEWFANALTEQAIENIPVIGKEAIAAWNELINHERNDTTYSALVTPMVKAYKGYKQMAADDSDAVMKNGMTKFETGAWNALEAMGLGVGGMPVTLMRRLRRALAADDLLEAMRIMCAMRWSGNQ